MRKSLALVLLATIVATAAFIAIFKNPLLAATLGRVRLSDAVHESHTEIPVAAHTEDDLGDAPSASLPALPSSSSSPSTSVAAASSTPSITSAESSTPSTSTAAAPSPSKPPASPPPPSGPVISIVPAEVIPDLRVRIALPTDDVILGCYTYRINITVLSGTLDPETAHLTVKANGPDLLFYNGKRPDHHYFEWPAIVCKEVPNLEYCKTPNMGQTLPPEAFSYSIALVKDADGSFFGHFQADASAREYNFVMDSAAEVEYASNSTILTGPQAWAKACWSYQECHPIINRPLPPHTNFALYESSTATVPIPCGNSLSVTRPGQTLSLFIRPLPHTMAQYAEVIPTVSWYVYLTSPTFLLAGDVSKWDAETQSWTVTITPRDPEQYKVFIVLSWYNGMSEFADPVPYQFGGHMQHEVSFCELTRGTVFGCVMGLTVPGEIGLKPKEGSKRCKVGNAPGRWVNVPLWDCMLPYCSGDRTKTKVPIEGGGGGVGGVYTPYNCHYHIFPAEDIDTCVRETGVQWVHVTGDSTAREFPEVMYDQYNYTVFGRFEEADKILGPTKFRVTFQFFNYLYGKKPLDKRVFAEQDQPLFDLYNVTCPAGTPACPDILLLNPAMCYTAWKQTLADYKVWLGDLLAYVKRAKAAPKGPRKAKLRVIWYRAPMLWGQAHSHSSPFITSERILAMDEYSIPKMRDAGVEIFDTYEPTRSRPDESFDGTHYLAISMDAYGASSNMVANMVLNTIFRDCSVS